MGLAQYQYNEGDSEWFSTFLARVEKQSKGYIGISLTNYNTSTVCAIAVGSVVEINGALFICSTETSITGSIATGLNYIILSVTGTTASPYFSQAAGTWDEDKQGWYTGNARYIGGFNSDGTKYNDKYIYHKNDNIEHSFGANVLRCKVIEIGDWNMDTTDVKIIAHGMGDIKKIRSVNALILRDDSILIAPLNRFDDNTDPNLISGGISGFLVSDVYLYRRTLGYFDNSDFSSTSFNRGWIIIWFEA